MKLVPCSYKGCSCRRPHHESLSDTRLHQMVEVRDDFEGKAYCSLECQAYDKPIIPDSLVVKVAEFLGTKGVHYFRTIKKIHKTVSPILRIKLESGGILPHPVHFREGMQIRNFMRSQDECKNWSQEELDNNWQRVIERLLNKEKHEI